MKRKSFPVFFLIFINSIIYFRWLTFSVFTYSDWYFYFKESLVDQFASSVWNSTGMFNFGYVDVTLWKLPIYLLTGAFGKLGFDYNVAEKFIVFWPIIFGLSLSSYFLIRHIIKSDSGAFIGSLVFSYSTYFLSIDSQGHQFLPASFVFSTLAILFYIKLFEERKFYLAVITGILLAVSGAYDLRSLYISVGILLLYFAYDLFINFSTRKKYLFRYLLFGLVPFILFFLLSMYWVLPILLTGYISGNSFLGRQIFGSEFYNLQSSMSTFFPFWTGKETTWFIIQKVPFVYWTYPILAIVGIVFNRINKVITFFSLLMLIGIFLSKQADIPFALVYGWLYTHIPGFSAFREASKFNFLTAIGYAVLIGSFVKWVLIIIPKQRLIKALLIFILSLFFLWNGIPIFTGSIKQLYIPHVIPKEFVKLNKFIVYQPSFFRTFWINMSTHWTIFNNNHPELEGALIFNGDWQHFFPDQFTNRNLVEGKKIMNILKTSRADRVLDLSSVKYIIVPLYDKETNNDIVKGFDASRQYYINTLSEINYLTKIKNMPDNIQVYENKYYRPHLYITYKKESLDNDIPFQNVKHSTTNSSEYIVILNNIKRPVWLNFTENYHPGWKIRIGNTSWYDSLVQKDYYLGDNLHERSVVNFNSFYIDPVYICKIYNCQRNSDGSFSLKLTLYFKSQSYLYLGIVLSGVTLFFASSYLLYYVAKKRQS